MTVIALTSLRGSPGVTTLTVAAASVWPADRRVRVIEADPAGGVLAARSGLVETTGTGTLAAAVRRQSRPEVLDTHSQQLPGGTVPVVVAPSSPEHAAASISLLARRIPSILSADDTTDTVIDCGRLFTGSPARPFLELADLTVMVTLPQADALAGMRYVTESLQRTVDQVHVITVGSEPYGPREAATFLDAPVSVLASDRRAAEAFAGRRSGRPLPRSNLVRSARSLIDQLLGSTSSTPETGENVPVEVAP